MWKFIEQYPSLILAFLLAAFLGGILGFVFFTLLYKRNPSKFLKLEDDNLASEIINLRTRIQTVYIVGPLAAFILAFFGLRSLQDIRSINNEYIDGRVKLDVKEWMNQNDLQSSFDDLIASKQALRLLAQGEGIVTKEELANYVVASEFNKRNSEIDRQIKAAISNYDYSPVLNNYLSLNNYLNKDAIDLELLKRVPRGEFDTYKKAVQDVLSGLDNRFLANQYLAEVQDYSIKKAEYVLRSELTNYLTDTKAETYNAAIKKAIDQIKKDVSEDRINALIASYQQENLKKTISEEFPYILTLATPADSTKTN